MIYCVYIIIIFSIFIFSVSWTTSKLIICRNVFSTRNKFSIISYISKFKGSPTRKRFHTMSMWIINMVSIIPFIKFCFTKFLHFFELLKIIFSINCISISSNSTKSFSFLFSYISIVTCSIFFVTFWNSVTINVTIWNNYCITIFIFFRVEQLISTPVNR